MNIRPMAASGVCGFNLDCVTLRVSRTATLRFIEGFWRGSTHYVTSMPLVFSIPVAGEATETPRRTRWRNPSDPLDGIPLPPGTTASGRGLLPTRHAALDLFIDAVPLPSGALRARQESA